MQNTPRGNRIHIGIFGQCNAGKSSMINAIANQQVALVTPTKGTTTDPVYKAMELLPLGPVVLMDTPGLDDTSEIGAQRMARTREVLRKTDIALMVLAPKEALAAEEEEVLTELRERGIPTLLIGNKADLGEPSYAKADVTVSAKAGENIDALKEQIARLMPSLPKRALVADLVEPGAVVVLVTPIDESAPKGRLILPQQQVIRDLLDHHATALVTQPEELAATLEVLKKPPALVITDSQAFGRVGEVVPREIGLTSFSILFARYKGILADTVRGVAAVKTLKAGDKVLISEGCTHHRQCEDIGTKKIPAGLKKYTGKELEIRFTSGGDFPQDLAPFALIIHCGACTLNEKEVEYRRRQAAEQGVPMTNYGVFLSLVQGTLLRSLEMFPGLTELL